MTPHARHTGRARWQVPSSRAQAAALQCDCLLEWMPSHSSDISFSARTPLGRGSGKALDWPEGRDAHRTCTVGKGTEGSRRSILRFECANGVRESSQLCAERRGRALAWGALAHRPEWWRLSPHGKEARAALRSERKGA